VRRARVPITEDRDFSPSATLGRFIARVSRHKPSFYFARLLATPYKPFYPPALVGDPLFPGDAKGYLAAHLKRWLSTCLRANRLIHTTD
jgi:hypothetical protein